MQDKAGKAQLDKLASILEGIFGVTDDAGMVLYSSSEVVGEGTVFDFTKAEVLSEEDADLFFCENFTFLKHLTHDRTELCFFLQTNCGREETKKLLQLAACAFTNTEDSQKKNTADFYRNLMLNGDSGVGIVDLNYYMSLYGSSLFGYLVILVSTQEDAAVLGDTEGILDLLMGIFPAKQGYYAVTLDFQTTAVVCPLAQKEDGETILQNADWIQDTLASELMVDTCVSTGSVVKRLKDLYLSYQHAKTAASIGIIFELHQKCFHYDKLGVERLIYELPISTCSAFLRETLGEAFLRDRFSGELLSTLKAFFDNNQNVSEASRALYIHRNTLMYRLEKFNKLTQLDCSRFQDGVKIEMALLIRKYLEKEAPEELRLST